MLNESFLLLKALERAGLALSREHSRVKPPGRSTGRCLRVRLDKEGGVTSVETVIENEWPGLWTVMEGNHNSFPVVRVKEPLIDVPRDSHLWSELGFNDQGKRRKPPNNGVRLAALVNARSTSQLWFSRKNENDWRRLKEKASELLRHKAHDDEGHYMVLYEFARRFEKAANHSSDLLEKIIDRVLHDVQHARLDDIQAVETLLVGNGPPNTETQRPQKISIQLAFDVADYRFPLRLYSHEVREHVKRILPKEPEGKRNRPMAEDRYPVSCAYIGEEQPLQTTPFPEVMLPVLNKRFRLVSMFSEAPCNKRYNLSDSGIVPVSQEAAERMRDALTFIVSDERKGKTWRGVANGKFDIRNGRKTELSDLLVVYVDGKPQIPAPIADLFGTDQDQQEKQFEVDAKAVCDALDGLERERPGSKLNLFLLRKASEGQAHVVLAETPSVEQVLDSAQWWQRAAANAPTVVLGQSRTPYPDGIVRLLAEEWVSNGTRSLKIPGVGLGEVLDVLLRRPGKMQSAAHHMLDLAMRRLSSLFLGLLSTQERKKYPEQSRKAALYAISMLGILLDAIGRQKETYMNGAPFLIGRLLSLADTLHREYCTHVRGGDIPPQLIGNALMPAAADNPMDAVDRLRERVLIYKAWADKVDGENYRLAKWSANQIGQICHQLSELELPRESDTASRAELFLGYMARPSTTNKDDDKHSNQKGTNNAE